MSRCPNLCFGVSPGGVQSLNQLRTDIFHCVNIACSTGMVKPSTDSWKILFAVRCPGASCFSCNPDFLSEYFIRCRGCCHAGCSGPKDINGPAFAGRYPHLDSAVWWIGRTWPGTDKCKPISSFVRMEGPNIRFCGNFTDFSLTTHAFLTRVVLEGTPKGSFRRFVRVETGRAIRLRSRI